jgi:hypothetical protein
MLSELFNLNKPFEEFDEIKLAEHLKTSQDLRSVLYRPDKWISEPTKFKSFSFTNVSLSKTQFNELTFTACQFEDCLFIGSRFINVEFHRCKFINCNFYKASFDNCYIDPATLSFDRRFRRQASNICVGVYQQLYENSSNTRQVDFARTADFEFRRWKRWQLRFDHEDGRISRFDRVLKWCASLAYEFVAGFGYKPWRFVVATLLLFTSMSMLNMGVLSNAVLHESTVVNHMTFADAVFYTYSMMTVLGFSTIVPVTNFAKILAVSEALLGIGWLGIFTSLLVKRFIK